MPHHHHQELPGFYYDEQKKRYFPLRSPIPGAARRTTTPSSSSSSSAKKLQVQERRSSFKKETVGQGIRRRRRRSRRNSIELVQGRELDGSSYLPHEFCKLRLSQPLVWKYVGSHRICDTGLEQVCFDIQTPDGSRSVHGLIMGASNAFLSLFEVGKSEALFDSGLICIPERVWPEVIEKEADCINDPSHIWRPAAGSQLMSSNISSIKLPKKLLPRNDVAGFNIQRALVTTLGSETSGGSICTMNFVEPVDYNSPDHMRQMVREVATFNCTLWTADCNNDASQAVIGTNLGAALVDLETGSASWILRSKSDVLAQQLDQSGNVVLCGLRNGAIVTVDVREKQQRPSARLMRHRITFPLGRQHQNPSKQWFELKGDIDPSCTVCMPSSVCCLVSLLFYNQYFLASSMDGSIKLYDHRMTKRGAVQIYEGHLNSHTISQLGVDQSEKFFMAGGEDCNLRLWNIKSGELLFDERLYDSVPLTMSWTTSERFVRTLEEGRCYQDQIWDAWFGSREGIFHMRWT